MVYDPNHKETKAEYEFRCWLMAHPDVLIDQRPYGPLTNFGEALAHLGIRSLHDGLTAGQGRAARFFAAAARLHPGHGLNHFLSDPDGDLVELASLPAADDLSEATMPAEVAALVRREHLPIYPTRGHAVTGDPIPSLEAPGVNYAFYRCWEDERFTLREHSRRLPQAASDLPDWCQLAPAAGLAQFVAPADFDNALFCVPRTPAIMKMIGEHRLIAVLTSTDVYILTSFDNPHTANEHPCYTGQVQGVLHCNFRDRRFPAPIDRLSAACPLPGMGSYFTRGTKHLTAKAVGAAFEIKETLS